MRWRRINSCLGFVDMQTSKKKKEDLETLNTSGALLHSVWRWVPNADLGFHVSAALLGGGAAPLLSTVQLSPSLQQEKAVVPSCWVCSSPRAAELRSYQLSNALSMLRVKAAAIAPV